MNAKWVGNLSLAAVVSLSASAAQATPIVEARVFGYDLVQVGNPGNAGQTQTYNVGGTLTFGVVADVFWIGKNHVTIGQYAEFLNAVAKSDPRGLYNSAMGSDQRIRGIERSGADGSYVYTVVGPNGTNPVGAQSAANRPITFVSWFDSARFANWMANGKLTGVAGAASIDDGAYTLGTATTGNAVAKNTINPNTGAAPTFYIPTENEWYKAAYYSPVKVGPTSPGYFLYGTQSDETPGNGYGNSTALFLKDLPNQANYPVSSRLAVTGTTGDPGGTGNQNILTDVGTFTESYSYYGAFDMSGNVWDWNDLNGMPGSDRGRRGGRWGDASETWVSSAERSPWVATLESPGVGFRLASPVPEPATLGMASTGALCAGGWWILKRRRLARS